MKRDGSLEKGSVDLMIPQVQIDTPDKMQHVSKTINESQQ